MARIIYACLIGVTAGFMMGAQYVYNYHTEQKEQLWSKH